MGPGLKNGVMRSKRKNWPLKASVVPFCQQSQIARMARTTSRIFGAGDSNFTEKRRSLWPFTCEPSPRMKRPPEAFEVPGDLGEDHRAARERDGDRGAELDLRRHGGRDGERQERIVLGLRRPDA